MCVTGGSDLPERVRKGLLREATLKLRFKDGEQLTRQRKVRKSWRGVQVEEIIPMELVFGEQTCKRK